MGATYLDTIIDAHRARASRDTRSWRDRLPHVHRRGASFRDALLREPHRVAVIAEIKRRSPSKGWLNDELDVLGVAEEYVKGGCTAISVLTDEDFFSGSDQDLRDVARAFDVPLLRKDFTVSANDVLDAAEMGASAILLIVAALSDEELELFVEVAGACDLDALVEVHDETEVARALGAGARIIGVNQRDLKTFDVDPGRACSVLARIPEDVLSVAESGLSEVGDVERVARCGCDAVLVGETFVRSSEPGRVVREFASVERHPRG